MRELVEYIARRIVNNPDQVVVTEEPGEDGVVLIKLKVAEEDRGRVIGKQGRVAQAMRSLLRVMAARAGTRVNLEII